MQSHEAGLKTVIWIVFYVPIPPARIYSVHNKQGIQSVNKGRKYLGHKKHWFCLLCIDYFVFLQLPGKLYTNSCKLLLKIDLSKIRQGRLKTIFSANNFTHLETSNQLYWHYCGKRNVDKVRLSCAKLSSNLASCARRTNCFQLNCLPCKNCQYSYIIHYNLIILDIRI